MITAILRMSSPALIEEAREWTADALHVPVSTVSPTVAVAYVERYYGQGRILQEAGGWAGFSYDREA